MSSIHGKLMHWAGSQFCLLLYERPFRWRRKPAIADQHLHEDALRGDSVVKMKRKCTNTLYVRFFPQSKYHYSETLL